MGTETSPVYSMLARGLAELGVSHVFGLLGHGNFMLVDDLVRHHGIRYVPVNREDAAVGAADAFGRVSGRLGVATVTHGPGLTNTVTTLHEAARARTPLLLLAGDTDPYNLAHEQDIDQRSTVAPTGAGFVPLRSADTVFEDLSVAARQAVVERRPVVFNLPVDRQDERVTPEQSDWQPPRSGLVEPDPDTLDRALGVLAVSQRPIVLAGRGALEPEAREALLRLAELLRAPLATTLLARNLFRGETFDLGVLGTISSSPVIDAVARADCIVAFGASLNRYTTAQGGLTSGKRVVHVDNDPGAIGNWQSVDVGVVGDAGRTAASMANALEDLGEPPAGLRSDTLARRLREHVPESEFQDVSTDQQIDPRTLLVWLDRILPPERTLVTDVGSYIRAALRYVDTPDPRGCVVTGNFGSIGLGMGAAIGAAFANRERPVLAVVGDGGFMMGGLNELEAAIRHHLDLIVVVMNNGGYELERRALEAQGCDPALAETHWPGFSEIARALGGEGIEVRALADLEDAAERISRRGEPLLIDAHVASPQ